MSVDHPADFCDAKGLRDGVRIHIHDFRDGPGGVLAAARACLIREQLTIRQRKSQEAPLPGRGSNDAAQLLIRVVVDTERITMGEQDALAIEFRHHRVWQ